MIRAVRLTILAILILLTLILAAACTQDSAEPTEPATEGLTSPPAIQSTAFAATPFSERPTPSASPLTPKPEEFPCGVPYSEPISWVGPLLYRARLYDSDCIPVLDLGSGQVAGLSIAEPALEVLDWSPDGCVAAYSWREGYDASQVGVRYLDIVSMEDTAGFTIPLSTSGPSTISLRWSPTGEWIAFSNGRLTVSDSELYLIRQGERTSLQITSNDHGDQVGGWSEDGHYLLYMSQYPVSEDESEWGGMWQLHVLDVRAMEEEVLATFSLTSTRWSRVVFTDVQTLQPVQFEMPRPPADVDLAQLFWTHDLRHFVILTAQTSPDLLFNVNLFWIDVATGQVEVLNNAPVSLLGPSQSPDRDWLGFEALGYEPGSGDQWRSYMLDMRTAQTHIIGEGFPYSPGVPRWSPDGEWIYLANYEGGFLYHLSSEEFDPIPETLAFYRWDLEWAPQASYGSHSCSPEHLQP